MIKRATVLQLLDLLIDHVDQLMGLTSAAMLEMAIFGQSIIVVEEARVLEENQQP